MKRGVGAVVRAMGAVALLGSMPQIAPPASAAPQQQQSGGPGRSAGLPWAYGFATSAAQPGTPTAPAAAAAPAAPAEDMDAFHRMPGSAQTFNLRQVGSNTAPADWFPGDHPAMPEVVAHGRTPAVAACGFCHYPNGKGRPNNAGPAGLPANYILQQLEDFATGARSTWDKRKRNVGQMADIARNLTPEDAKAAAEYFASMKWTPWIKVIETDSVPKTVYVGGGGGLCLPLEGDRAAMEPLGMRIVETPMNVEQTEPLRNPRSGFIAYVPLGSLKKGEDLAVRGGSGRTVACAACHGGDLKGSEDFPSLAGRSPSYLARQLYDFQHFTRVGPGSQFMQPIVRKLSEEDILDISAYLASLQP